MARAALDWTTRVLAERAGVGVNTVTRFEQGGEALVGTVAKLRSAFEAAGVEFIPANGSGPGVRLKKAVGAS
jgi:transcriptional regulator with XRE-family HTH domain